MGKRILISDDAMFMRTMLKDILKQAGYDICGEAKNGKIALEMYNELQPDLVTLDIIMPIMNGIEVVKKIKETNPSAKILMCSAMGQQQMIQKAIQAGADDFIIKPFQPARVLEAVETVLK